MRLIPLMLILLVALTFYAAIPLAILFHHWWIWPLVWIVSGIAADIFFQSEPATERKDGI
jgi:hypothetical protein